MGIFPLGGWCVRVFGRCRRGLGRRRRSRRGCRWGKSPQMVDSSVTTIRSRRCQGATEQGMLFQRRNPSIAASECLCRKRIRRIRPMAIRMFLRAAAPRVFGTGRHLRAIQTPCGPATMITGLWANLVGRFVRRSGAEMFEIHDRRIART